MADNDQSGNQANGGAQTQPQFALQRIYVKDLSFESPRAPQSFQEEWKPEVQMDINTSAKKLGENVFEVVLSITITTQCNEQPMYLAEVQQAGIFAISGIPQAELEQTLGAYCPNILFPYARETVDNLVMRGSFPPVHLAPVNFEAVFAEAMKRKAEQQADGSDSAATTH
jgi:preprotein translocase subunit SecB